eukprot:SAG11_NODE_3604_length_2350_cov_15.146102_1_plen_93_part_00
MPSYHRLGTAIASYFVSSSHRSCTTVEHAHMRQLHACSTCQLFPSSSKSELVCVQRRVVAVRCVGSDELDAGLGEVSHPRIRLTKGDDREHF